MSEIFLIVVLAGLFLLFLCIPIVVLLWIVIFTTIDECLDYNLSSIASKATKKLRQSLFNKGLIA